MRAYIQRRNPQLCFSQNFRYKNNVLVLIKFNREINYYVHPRFTYGINKKWHLLEVSDTMSLFSR